MSDFYFEGGETTKSKSTETVDNFDENGDLVLDGYKTGVSNDTYTDRNGVVRNLHDERNIRPTKPFGCCLISLILMFAFPLIIGAFVFILGMFIMF